MKTIEQLIEELSSHVDEARDAALRAEKAADKAADAAQKVTLAYESMSERFALLRHEHVENHGDSQVPVMISTKRNPG